MKAINPYKKRWIIYLLVIAVFIPVSWNLAFKKTVELMRQEKSMEEKLQQVNTAPARIAAIKKRLAFVDKLVSGTNQDERLQNRVLAEISRICRQNGLLLYHMPPMYKEVDKNYLMETSSVEISGNFHKLLELLYQLEDPAKNMNIVASQFYTVEDKKEKSRKLYLKLYIQTLKNKNS